MFICDKYQEEVLEYISKCRYEGQVSILKDLIDKGRILENKINSSISTLLKKGFNLSKNSTGTARIAPS